VDLYLYHYSFDCSEVTQTTAFRLLLVISLLTLDVSIYVITQPNSLWKTAVLNIISGGKSLCPCTLLELIFPSTNMIVALFLQPTSRLFLNLPSLMIRMVLNNCWFLLILYSNSEDIKIGFESTAHYALNLETLPWKCQPQLYGS